MRMRKEEFLKQLEELLFDISEEERQEAMAFYRSYFEDAGDGNEEAILKELESPQKVAEAIKRDLGMVQVVSQEAKDADAEAQNGQSTWNAQSNQGAWNAQSGQNAQGHCDANAEHSEEYYKNVNDTIEHLQKENKNSNTVIIVLGIVIAVLTSPVWIGILGGIFGTLIGVSAGLAGAVLGLLGAGIGLIGVGIGCIFTGDAIVAIALLGAGFIVLAIGMLVLIAAVWFFGGFLPWACKGIWKLCKKPFEKGKERAAA